MQPHEERVVTEKADLDAKLERLKTFIVGGHFELIPKDEQQRLKSQVAIMDQYSALLGERIAAFPK